MLVVLEARVENKIHFTWDWMREIMATNLRDVREKKSIQQIMIDEIHFCAMKIFTERETKILLKSNIFWYNLILQWCVQCHSTITNK